MEKTIGKIIQKARSKKGYSLADVGKLLGYRYGNFIGMIENGKSPLPLEKIPAICEALDLDAKELFKRVMEIRHPKLARFID
jgi:transcriptional regulator with XRE-family HTH domain